MRDIGLVLAGGGGKGAYQIGVWRYLAESGQIARVCAVSGTSVGALNAALFAAGDLARAEDLWLNIEPEQVLTPRHINVEDIAGALLQTLRYAWQTAASRPSPLDLGKLLLGHIADKGYLFSHAGLRQLIRQGLDVPALKAAPCPCFATCLNLNSLSVRRFDLRRYSPPEIEQLLLASSALPAIFDEVIFHGEPYCDGGIPLLGDNVPVQPLYDAGIRRFIVVHLSQKGQLDPADFPKARLYQLIPRVDLGDTLTGTLDFSAEGANKRMLQGYLDAAAAFADWSL